MITLQEIHMEQFWDVIDLSVRPEQAEFCTSNAVSIAQSKVQSECIPLAIYDGETPVGFLMYCVDRDDGEWWIYRLMVDARFQGSGCVPTPPAAGSFWACIGRPRRRWRSMSAPAFVSPVRYSAQSISCAWIGKEEAL